MTVSVSQRSVGRHTWTDERGLSSIGFAYHSLAKFFPGPSCGWGSGKWEYKLLSNMYYVIVVRYHHVDLFYENICDKL